MQEKIKTILSFVLIFGIVIFGYIYTTSSRIHQFVDDQQIVIAGPNNFQVTATVAHSEKRREQGLSGTTTLQEKTGMFFVFDHSDTYGFWMKDMLYPIDIVWLDSNWRIIHIEEAVTPQSFPEVFKPMTPALYVIELPAHMTQQYAIDLGTLLNITQ